MMINKFPICFVINLESSKDRFEQFTKFPEIQRFEAINAKKLDLDSDEVKSKVIPRLIDDIKTNRRRKYPSDHNFGSIACMMSHLAVLKHFYDNYPDDEHCLVFEDDAKIENDIWKKKIILLLNELPNDFGCCSVGDSVPKRFGLGNMPNNRVTTNFSFSNVGFIYASAVLYKRSFIPTILKYAYPSSLQYDYYLAKLSNEFPKKVYMLSKRSRIFDLRRFPTTVQSIKNQLHPSPETIFIDAKEFRANVVNKSNTDLIDYTALWISTIVLVIVIIVVVIAIIAYCVSMKKQQKNGTTKNNIVQDKKKK